MQKKLKIAVTGHTSGLGKKIYEHYKNQNHEVLGISKSTGYDIIIDHDKILESVKGFDIFFNNVHIDNCQEKLLELLVNNVNKIIVTGSAMHLFRNIATYPYLEDKFKLSEKCKMLNVDPKVTSKILHLNISFLPNIENQSNRLNSDNYIEYSEILKSIDFWIENPYITDITFGWKITPKVYKELKKILPNFNYASE